MAAKGTLFGKPRDEVVTRPGAFTAKAKAAGKSTAGYAQQVLKEGSQASTRTKRQAALAQTFKKLRAGKAKFLIPFLLVGALEASAATVPCPSGWLIGPTAQAATGVSPNVIVPRGSASLIVQGLLTAGTATMQVEMCCSPADCTLAGSWAVVGTAMSLAVATPTVVVSVTAPVCTYRANVTACSTCSVTAVAVCGGA